MKALAVGILAAVLSVLLTAAVLVGYHEDAQTIPRFSGTGVAAKIDMFGAVPRHVALQDERSGLTADVSVAANGAFAARLAPGRYRLTVPGDSRSTSIIVPDGDCLEVILDYRVPGVVLQVPG